MAGTQENGSIVSVKRSEPIFIQPETKTSNGKYLLSKLDQVLVAMMKTIYIYKLEDKAKSECALDVIKHALAKVLVHYYPLAGTLRANPSDGKFFVECIDTAGVPFVEAIADCNVDTLGDITAPEYAMLEKFIYEVPEVENIIGTPLMTVQVTKFKCGNFVLGLSMNHCIADGISAMEFVNSWAETARGTPLTTPPVIDNSILKSRVSPSGNINPSEKFAFVEISDVSNLAGQYEEEKMLYRSFSFDQNKLASLKKKAMEEDAELSYCSSFTVLAALVWRARSKALKMKPHQDTKLVFTVNIRSKLGAPLPKGYFGNGIVTTECLCTAGELIEKPFSFAVKLVQNSIQKINDDYVQSYIEFFEHVSLATRPSFTATLMLTSWTRIPFNAGDFGWGKPTQFGAAIIPEVGLFRPDPYDPSGTTVVLGLPVSAMNTFQELMKV